MTKKQENEKLIAHLELRKYDPNKPPPAEQIVCIIESKNIGTLQNFITLTGLQKSGKTTFMAAIIAGGITHQEQLGIRIHLPEKKRRVAYFDTEQGDWDFYRTMEKIKTFCKLDKLPPWFDSFNLREDEPRIACLLIEKYLEKNPDCGLLLIDGILDLIESFNDEAESKRLVNFLKRITKQYGLLAVLTLHKGKTTANTLGHLGSMADRAAQSVLFVEKIKERNTFILKADYLRSADDFTPIEITYNKNLNEWVQTFYNPEQDSKVRKLTNKPHDYDREYHSSMVVKIFRFSDTLQYNDLVQSIKEFYAVGTNWAKDCVKYLMEQQLIFRTEKAYTNRVQAKLFLTK